MARNPAYRTVYKYFCPKTKRHEWNYWKRPIPDSRCLDCERIGRKIEVTWVKMNVKIIGEEGCDPWEDRQ